MTRVNQYGSNLRLSIFGGSHDPEIGMTLEGLPAGIRLPEADLLAFMARRAPGRAPWATARKEADTPVFTAGVQVEETAEGRVYVSDGTAMGGIIRIRDQFHIAIMLIEHDMSLVMGICEGICVLNYGRIIAKGTADEIQANPDVIEAYLGKKKEGGK
jgi:hypothetical protein